MGGPATLALGDAGPVRPDPFPQQGSVRESCGGATMPAQCSPAIYFTGPGDPTAGDDQYTRRVAFVNLATVGPGAPFLADCVASARGIDVRQAAPGTLMTFTVSATDRAGTTTTWPAQPAATVAASTFACSGDPCLCCFLEHGLFDGPCGGLPGLVGPADPAGACRP
jgi:hypothetical protein